jgi:dipeptidyl aminopeptidase/acylaminoacyl peptidase
MSPYPQDRFDWVETPHGHCPVFTLLPDAQPAPAVVFCHGYTGDSHEANRMFWRLSRALHGIGIASIRFEYNGFGNSSGSSARFTVATGIDDTVAVLRHAVGVPGIAPDRLGLFGWSLGGRIAAAVLGQRAELRAGVLCNAVAGLWKSYDNVQELLNGYEGDTTWDGGWELPKSFFSTQDFGDGAIDAANAEAALLIVNGADDSAIPPKTGDYYLEQRAKHHRSAERQIIFGGNHVFTDPDSAVDLIDRTTDFFNRTLFG